MNERKKGLNVGVKSFITAIVVIFILMIATYALTLIVPGGYIPFWKWVLSPFLVLGSEGNGSLIAVIVFLLVIGGVFNCLEKCGLMMYMLENITERFGKERYKLLAYVTLFFMAMGSFIGSFEECVPLVPIMIALAIRLGWDAFIGVGMSLLAIGCGFAAGVCNPFTVGVAQELAGLPMFSGIWFRLLSFALVYFLLLFFFNAICKKNRTSGGREARFCHCNGCKNGPRSEMLFLYHGWRYSVGAQFCFYQGITGLYDDNCGSNVPDGGTDCQ